MREWKPKAQFILGTDAAIIGADLLLFLRLFGLQPDGLVISIGVATVLSMVLLAGDILEIKTSTFYSSYPKGKRRGLNFITRSIGIASAVVAVATTAWYISWIVGTAFIALALLMLVKIVTSRPWNVTEHVLEQLLREIKKR